MMRRQHGQLFMITCLRVTINHNIIIIKNLLLIGARLNQQMRLRAEYSPYISQPIIKRNSHWTNVISLLVQHVLRSTYRAAVTTALMAAMTAAGSVAPTTAVPDTIMLAPACTKHKLLKALRYTSVTLTLMKR